MSLIHTTREFAKSFRGPVEFLAWQRKKARRDAMRDKLVAAYLAAPGKKKLQIGSGNNLLPGWLNTDRYTDVAFDKLAYLDVGAKFPFPDNSFDYVFSEHMIEHVPYNAGQFMLKECYRILKPGGKIRIATPELSKILALYNETLTPGQQRYIDWSINRNNKDVGIFTAPHVINTFMNAWGHKFVYDVKSLKEAFASAGFVNLTEQAPEKSDDPELAGIEMHAQEIKSVEFNEVETQVLEGTKPGKE